MKRLIFLLAVLFLIPAQSMAKHKKVIEMGLFKITAYCPCDECSEGYGRKCAKKDTYARSEHTIAVDPDIIDLGSKVKVGKKYYVAEDIGGRVNGDIIDVFFDTHEDVEEFGVKYKNVKVIKERDG